MNLRHYREQAGITQKRLEDLSGVKQVTISKLETGGSCVPTLPVARKLVNALVRSGCDVTIDMVFPPAEKDLCDKVA